ncbi:MAG: hypothetical protein AVDCRST_MAG14-176 [uncultured Rubrobacteraceae bacterium]|uniref:Uncharacterized protein n=1 Tax=uncultured Rubrobacteraceae bacterium TaxID=349277 RepID=A0A6J4QKU2_9ACTN|nr:MAG: hypothetical protein AVDCRST_MAG14-176 [uncultured Rubrobacteraceae bacterium]
MSSSNWIRWGGRAAILGGALWAIDWILFIIGHSLTHVNQGREVLGLRPDAWDHLSVIPLGLIAVGLVAVQSRQAVRTGWPGKDGYAVSLVGLALWTVANLLRLPPGGILVFAIGMVLFGVGTLRAAALPRWSRGIPLILGVLLVPGFVLTFPGLVLSFEFADAIGAFGLAGLFTHIAQGLGWVLLGYTLWSEKGRPVRQPMRVR